MFQDSGSRGLSLPSQKMQEGEAVTIRCAHGDTVLYPLAKVKMEIDGRQIQVEAAVSNTLPVSVLLGTDVAELGELLGGGVLEKVRRQKDDTWVVTTRAQAKRQEAEEEAQHKKQLESSLVPRPRPAFRRYSVLQATKSWAGPGNEANWSQECKQTQ